MKTFRFKAPWFLTLVFVLLIVVLSFPMTGSVSAQSGQDDSYFIMPYPNYQITDYCHFDDWYEGVSRCPCAIDLQSIPITGPLYSPINGVVTNMGDDDNTGNPFIQIENSRYRIRMLHGNYYLASYGMEVEIGQHLGNEDRKGPTSTGYHTHINVFDKLLGIWVNPLEIINTPPNLEYVFISNQTISSNTTYQVAEAVVSTPQPQPPGKMTISTEEIQGEELANRVEAPVVTEATTQISEQVSTVSQNPFKIFLGRQHWGWWVLVIGILIYFIMINQYARSLSLVWILIAVPVILSFFWSRSFLPTFAMPKGVAASVVAPPEEGTGAEVAQNSIDEDEPIMFPAIPIPQEVVEAIENPVVQPPQGSSYFPDPGLSMARTVEILWEMAEERGMPPQIGLAKFYYEGCYEYNGNWMFLRNWQPNGTLVKSPSYANCVGIGQVCTYWHPSFDPVKAGDLNDPEAAFRYSAGYALDFFKDMYLAEGTWWGAVRRYHGTQAEAEQGYAIIKKLVNESPINPETGRAAWPRAESGLAILEETSLRSPILK